jgi:hypothetical protein
MVTAVALLLLRLCVAAFLFVDQAGRVHTASTP